MGMNINLDINLEVFVFGRAGFLLPPAVFP